MRKDTCILRILLQHSVCKLDRHVENVSHTTNIARIASSYVYYTASTENLLTQRRLFNIFIQQLLILRIVVTRGDYA